MIMKALSIKQPWATLIVKGIKDIENRSWKTNFRGRIYIHSTAIFSKSQKEILNDLVINKGMTCYDEETYPTSAIIGEVDIIDCVLNHKSIWAQEGFYHWVLSNPTFYIHPYTNIKGKLSFWEFDKRKHLLSKTYP